MMPIQGPAGLPPKVDRRRRRVIRIVPSPGTLIILVLLIPGLWLLSQLLPVLLVLVAALIIVGTISPAIRWLEKRRMRRGLDIAIVFTALVVLTVLFITLTIPSLMTQVINLLEQEPALHSRLVTWWEGSHLTSTLAELLSRVPTVIFVVLVLMLAYKELESRVIIPRIYARALRLPSAVILFSLLAGTVLWGIPGALLALPVAAAMRMLLEERRVELA